MKLVVKGTILLAIIVCVPCFAVVSRSSSMDDILFLKTTQDNGGPFFHDIYDLGPSLDNGGNGQAITQHVSTISIFFMTLPLANDFFLPNVTLTVYHDKNPYDDSNFTAILYRYNATQQQEPAGPGYMNSVTMDVNSTVDSITFNLDLQFLKADRILVWVCGVWSRGNRLDWYWGNNTYPSRISYPGAAQYVPEFQAALFIPILMGGALLAAIVYRPRLERARKRRLEATHFWENKRE
jgi:hypothetical protein